MPRSTAKATSQGGMPGCTLGTSEASAAMARVTNREPVGPGLTHDTVMPPPGANRWSASAAAASSSESRGYRQPCFPFGAVEESLDVPQEPEGVAGRGPAEVADLVGGDEFGGGPGAALGRVDSDEPSAGAPVGLAPTSWAGPGGRLPCRIRWGL